MSRGPVRYKNDGFPAVADEGTMTGIKTHEGTRPMYQSIVDLGIRIAGPFDEERIAFEEAGMMFYCVLSVVYPGRFFAKLNQIVDPDAYYLVRWPNVTRFNYDVEGLLTGEWLINGAPVTVQSVDQSLIAALIDGPRPEL